MPKGWLNHLTSFDVVLFTWLFLAVTFAFLKLWIVPSFFVYEERDPKIEIVHSNVEAATPPSKRSSSRKHETKKDLLATPSKLDFENMVTREHPVQCAISVKISNPQSDQRFIVANQNNVTSAALPYFESYSMGKTTSWNLDKKPSLSSLSASSVPISVSGSLEPRPTSVRLSSEEIHIVPHSSKNSAARRRRRRNGKEKGRQRSSTVPAPNNWMPPPSVSSSFWAKFRPLANSSLILPPPELVLKPPPGLDPPKKVSLRADAQPFNPSNNIWIDPSSGSNPRHDPPLSVRSVRSENSHASSERRSSRASSFEFNSFFSFRTTDDGHDADDEEESYCDEDCPSVDLSFLE